VRQVHRIRVLRSKNAGPFVVTFDVVFKDRRDFEKVRDALTSERIAEGFGVSPDRVLPLACVPDLLAMKFSVMRSVPSGHPGDADCYGMNQEVPLALLIDDILEEL